MKHIDIACHPKERSASLLMVLRPMVVDSGSLYAQLYNAIGNKYVW